MARRTFDLQNKIEFLSILDENTDLDAALEPELPKELLVKMFWFMLLGRRHDERMLKLQRQGRIGTFAPITGMEAAHVGAIAAIRDEDWFVPQLREAAAEYWRGRKLESILLFHAGYEEGIEIAAHWNNTPIGIVVAGQLPHAVGIAYGIKYRRSSQIVLTFLGDGGTSQGDFHEALNTASVFQVPVVFVCQNNQWANSVPLSRQTHSRTLAQKAIAYDMPGLQVDGNDVLAVYVAVKEAVDRARSGGGPSFIEALTYRVLMHTTADDPNRYRSEQEVEVWRKRDPLTRFGKYLTQKGVLGDEEIEDLEVKAKKEIDAAVKRFDRLKNEYSDPLHIFEHHYAELPAPVREQRRQKKNSLAAGGAPEA